MSGHETQENMYILQIHLKPNRTKVKLAVELSPSTFRVLSASKIIIVLLLFKTFRAF